jgi:hypothetical protein
VRELRGEQLSILGSGGMREASTDCAAAGDNEVCRAVLGRPRQLVAWLIACPPVIMKRNTRRIPSTTATDKSSSELPESDCHVRERRMPYERGGRQMRQIRERRMPYEGIGCQIRQAGILSAYGTMAKLI